MNESNSDSSSDLSESFPHVKISVGTKKNYGLIYGILYFILWITINLILVFLFSLDVNLIEDFLILFVLNLFLVGLGILCWKLGFLRRKETLIFTIHPYKNQLIYERFWSHIRTIEKKYQLEEIVGFDVYKTRAGITNFSSPHKELVLKFKLDKPKFLTGEWQDEDIVEKAKELNHFLISNTKLEQRDLSDEIKPKIFKRSGKRLKLIFIFILIGIIAVILYFSFAWIIGFP
jgi:hypothetical protein